MNYKKNFFYVENISTEKLSKKFKTPLYCYSYLKIKNNINNYKNNFKKINPLICFSVKSNSNIKMLAGRNVSCHVSERFKRDQFQSDQRRFK